MKLAIVVTRLAKRDLEELVVYIGEDNPGASVEVVNRILDRIEMLGEQPGIGRPGRRAGTRELVVEGTRYIVAYREDATRGQIQVLRVLHAARLWPRRI